MLRWSVQILFTVVGFLLSIHAWAGPTDSNSNILRTQLAPYFDAYANSSDFSNRQILGKLLDTRSQSQLAFPPFPRTWLELGRSEPKETTTTATFDTAKIISAVEVFSGPMSGAAKAIMNTVQPALRQEVSTKYSYNFKTTFMAMSSLRPINPEAARNIDDPVSIPPASAPEKSLRPILRWDSNLKRTYFNTSRQYPIVAICKYELSLAIGETDTRTVTFIAGSNTTAKSIINEMSYSVFSNFFEVEPHVPVQEYLRTRCSENFTEAVRALAESDFNKLVAETFAYYHPQAQCQWTPEQTPHPRGDASCMEWYNNPRYVTESYRRANVPRCVLGTQGIPICVLRAKQGAQCPIYEFNGHLSENRPFGGGRQLNPTSGSLYPCDSGYRCMPADGTDPLQFSIGNSTAGRLWTRMTGVEARCRPRNGI